MYLTKRIARNPNIQVAFKGKFTTNPGILFFLPLTCSLQAGSFNENQTNDDQVRTSVIHLEQGIRDFLFD